MVLSVEACKALKKLGYPQDRYPTLYWQIVPCIAGCNTSSECLGEYGVSCDYPVLVGLDREMPGPEQYACPDSITALRWFREQGWVIGMVSLDSWYATRRGDVGTIIYGDTPSALILAVAAALEAK